MNLKQTLTIQTPGKLMVAGEYAVLEPNQSLIVMAVDRYVYTTIRKSEAYEFTSEDFQLYNLKWHYEKGRITFENYSPRLRFVTVAMATTLTYLQQCGITISPFSLTVRSELADKKSGAKYGLGSSAAVATGIVSAILEMFLRERPSREVIFKLAAIAHVRTQGSGSGADIAASTYGGVIHYRSFQAEWLKKQLTKVKKVKQIVHMTWDYLSIKKTAFPKDVTIYIGWTGKPASTSNLVSKIRAMKVTDRASYDSFLNQSSDAVDIILQGIEQNDVDLFFRGIKLNRAALAFLGEKSNVSIETEKLHRLSEVAERLGGAGKLSGAGGGDCGIAFLRKTTSPDNLYTKWRESEIILLDLQVNKDGTCYKK